MPLIQNNFFQPIMLHPEMQPKVEQPHIVNMLECQQSDTQFDIKQEALDQTSLSYEELSTVASHQDSRKSALASPHVSSDIAADLEESKLLTQ